MKRTARGFSLIEIMIAMTILTVMLAGFASMTYAYLKRVKTFDSRDAQIAVVAEQTQRLTVLPFDSLTARVGCKTFGGAFAFTRCIVLTATTPTRYQVKLIIASANAAIKPDTVSFHRVKRASNPLCTTC